ncbi:hypothetical protein [Microbacterium phyllosphaerae]
MAQPRTAAVATTLRTEPPTWAVVAFGVLLLVGLGFVLVAGSAVLYGFVGSMLFAGVLERVLDGRTPSWGEGHVVADLDERGVVFRTYRGTAVLAALFLAAVLLASGLFVAVLIEPGLDLPVWFPGFGAVLIGGVVYATRLIVGSVRALDVRLSPEGLIAQRPLGTEITVPWRSVVAASSTGTSILITTMYTSAKWPADRLRADPIAVADIIDRCAALPVHDTARIIAVIDDVLGAPSSR